MSDEHFVAWESEKKKPRGSKKARVDATDQNNAKVADAEEYFATPPPGTPPPANAFAPVRQPAPRSKSGRLLSYCIITYKLEQRITSSVHTT